jgi:hypothetical protein
MGLESATYISGLNASNPVTGDAKTEGDDHLRLIKSTLLATFPGVTGAVTSTHTELNLIDGLTSSAAELNILDGATLSTTELNYVDGVTSAIQTQLDAKYATSKITISTSAASGGSDKDIWFRY